MEQKHIVKTTSAYCKAGKTDFKVNRAYSQSRPSGILFAKGKWQVVFCAANFVFAAQNNLPPCSESRGEETRSEVVRFQIKIFNYRLTAFFTTKIQRI